jgi:hypothetical protein
MSIGGMRRRYTKEQFGKMAEGNLVSDRETQTFADQARDSAQAAGQAQTSILNRSAAANVAGSPVVAGAIKESAKKVADAGADAAVKATGQGQKFSEALREQRKSAALQLANQQIAQNRADLSMTVDTIMGAMMAHYNLG